MSKKKAVILSTLLLIFGVLLGVGSSYTFSHLDEIKSKTEAIIQNKDVAPPEIEEEIEEDDSILSEETTESEQNTTSRFEETINNLLQTPEDAVTTASPSTMDVAEIVDKCLPSVVAITNKGEKEIRSMWGNFKQETSSSGSGVIIGQNDSELLVLTNYHVVEGNEQLSVVFSWEENQETVDQKNIITAQVKDYDASRDIAVIAIDKSSLEQVTVDQITVASIGNSDDLKLGQQVVAIGNALGYGQSVTTGIVSALNRTVEAGNEIGSANKYIQTDAAINPGNSGGALFNMNGELIGINSAKIATSTVEGMGYAIPISSIMENVEAMMNAETRAIVEEANRGVLGISCIDVTSDISKSYGMPMGVYISDTTPGAGAEAAGLKKGDIITGLNGKNVNDTTQLKNYLSYYAAGETVTVTVSRQSDDGYTPVDVSVVLSPSSVNNVLGDEDADVDDTDEAYEQPENGENEDGDTEYASPYDQLFDFFNNFGIGGFGGFGH